METIFSICLGVGLGAACGFRVFVPLLVMSIAARSGHLTLGHGFEWIASDPALLTFCIAAVLEVSGYYVPWIGHLLDVIASPAAIIAGTVITASLVTDMSPFMKWTLAAIAGGGAAAMVQGTTVAVRGASTVTTAGLANPLVATLELVGSLMTSLAALVAPVLVVVTMFILVVVFGRTIFKKSLGLVRARHS